jgi:hypothetical protein
MIIDTYGIVAVTRQTSGISVNAGVAYRPKSALKTLSVKGRGCRPYFNHAVRPPMVRQTLLLVVMSLAVALIITL